MAGLARIAAVEVAHVVEPRVVGLVDVARGRSAIDALEPHALLDPRRLGPGQAHVQRLGVLAQHDRGGAAEDHRALPRGVLAQHLLGRLAEGVVGQHLLGHRASPRRAPA